MDLLPEELERIEAIRRHINGEKPVDIYRSIGRSKFWFNKWLKRFRSGQDQWYKSLPKSPKALSQKTDEWIEQAVVSVRKKLMDGSDYSMKYSLIGPEAVQYQMEVLGFKPSEIPSLSTVKRIIRRNKLRVNKKKRYKRIRSKGRHTILKPKYIDEMHQMDYVGPRHIKGYGPINSLHLKDYVGHQVAGNQYHEKSMDNVMIFLLGYWRHHPIPKYLQVDNGMCFAGDFRHPKSFSRFMRLALYLGIEIVFIAPARPWMNGTIEEFNKLFDELLWSKEEFIDLDDIRSKSQIMFESQNKFNTWKLKNEELKSIQPRRMLKEECAIDVNNLPLVTGKVHFIRMADSNGKINVLNEDFFVGKEYIGEYVWATIMTRKNLLIIYYKDKDLNVSEIKGISYEMSEKIHNRKHSLFRTGKVGG